LRLTRGHSQSVAHSVVRPRREAITSRTSMSAQSRHPRHRHQRARLHTWFFPQTAAGMRSEVSMRTESMTGGRASHPRGGAGKGHRADEHRRPVFPVLLTIDEAAELLRTTRRAIYAMVERRQLPGVIRIRRRVLFRADDLLDWLDQKRAPSPEE